MISQGTRFNAGDEINIYADDVYLLNSKDYDYHYSRTKKSQFAPENVIAEVGTAAVTAGAIVAGSVAVGAASFGGATPIAAGAVGGAVGGVSGAVSNAASGGARKGTITTEESLDETLIGTQFNADKININSRKDILMEGRTELNASNPDNIKLEADGEIIEYEQTEQHTSSKTKTKFGKSLKDSFKDGAIVGAIVGSVTVAIERTYCTLDPDSCKKPDDTPPPPVNTDGNSQTGNNANQGGSGEVDRSRGSLSERYESGGGGPGTVNIKTDGKGNYIKDANGNYVLDHKTDKGGFSYGVWQIAANTGSMDGFLDFTKTNYPEYYDALTNEGGGVSKAKDGAPQFVDVWQKLAESDPEKFRNAQWDYINSSHYLPRENYILKNYSSLDLYNRDPIIQDVIWSISVQHDGARTIFKEAFQNKPIDTMSDEAIIRALYGVRTDYVNRLPDMSAADKAKEAARYQEEMAKAIRAIK